MRSVEWTWIMMALLAMFVLIGSVSSSANEDDDAGISADENELPKAARAILRLPSKCQMKLFPGVKDFIREYMGLYHPNLEQGKARSPELVFLDEKDEIIAMRDIAKLSGVEIFRLVDMFGIPRSTKRAF